jgi:hypothetical protein
MQLGVIFYFHRSHVTTFMFPLESNTEHCSHGQYLKGIQCELCEKLAKHILYTPVHGIDIVGWSFQNHGNI